MAFTGSPAAAAAQFAFATSIYLPPGTKATMNWDTRSLNRVLKRLGKLHRRKNRIASEAMRAGMRIIAKDIKRRMPAYTPNRLSGSRLGEAKKATGSLGRISKGGGGIPRGQIEGKAGSGVGMKHRTSRMRPRRGRPGVGMGRGNLHFYLAGTAPRITRTGIYTGRMRRVTIVQQAYSASGTLAVAKMKVMLARGIAREAARP